MTVNIKGCEIGPLDQVDPKAGDEKLVWWTIGVNGEGIRVSTRELMHIGRFNAAIMRHNFSVAGRGSIVPGVYVEQREWEDFLRLLLDDLRERRESEPRRPIR